MNTELRVFVVTCRMPRGSGKHPSVKVAGRTVTATSSDGFRYEFELPEGARADGLEWQIYGEFLEIRVPYRSAEIEAETAYDD